MAFENHTDHMALNMNLSHFSALLKPRNTIRSLGGRSITASTVL